MFGDSGLTVEGFQRVSPGDSLEPDLHGWRGRNLEIQAVESVNSLHIIYHSCNFTLMQLLDYCLPPPMDLSASESTGTGSLSAHLCTPSTG